MELPEREFTPFPPIPAEREAWYAVQPAAGAFCERAAADPRISAEFRAICAGDAGAQATPHTPQFARLRLYDGEVYDNRPVVRHSKGQIGELAEVVPA